MCGLYDTLSNVRIIVLTWNQTLHTSERGNFIAKKIMVTCGVNAAVRLGSVFVGSIWNLGHDTP
jgi:hypothetical protein